MTAKGKLYNLPHNGPLLQCNATQLVTNATLFCKFLLWNSRSPATIYNGETALKSQTMICDFLWAYVFWKLKGLVQKQRMWLLMKC